MCIRINLGITQVHLSVRVCAQTVRLLQVLGGSWSASSNCRHPGSTEKAAASGLQGAVRATAGRQLLRRPPAQARPALSKHKTKDPPSTLLTGQRAVRSELCGGLGGGMAPWKAGCVCCGVCGHACCAHMPVILVALFVSACGLKQPPF